MSHMSDTKEDEMAADIKKNDTVRFVYEGKTRQGKVTHVGNRQAVITMRADGFHEGGTVMVPFEDILRVIK